MFDQEKFATVINCMDGRVQRPVNEWIKKNYAVQYVDTITEPGPNKILAINDDSASLKSIRNRINISVLKHGSRLIAIAGHHDCAGNPSDKETQTQHILTAIDMVKSWKYDATIIGLWIDEKWIVHEVK